MQKSGGLDIFFSFLMLLVIVFVGVNIVAVLLTFGMNTIRYWDRVWGALMS